VFAILGEGQQRRHHGNRGVSHHLKVDIVEIERVRGRAVDQRGIQHGVLSVVADNARLLSTAYGVGHFHQNLCERFIGAAKGHAQPIKQAKFRLVDDILREALVVHLPDRFAKLLCYVHWLTPCSLSPISP
jgi:hypothetical protein